MRPPSFDCFDKLLAKEPRRQPEIAEMEAQLKTKEASFHIWPILVFIMFVLAVGVRTFHRTLD